MIGTNDGPVAVADTAATTENAAVTKDVIANDTDVDATDVLSLKAASAAIATMTGPAGKIAVVTASVTQSGNEITFNPGTDFDFLADGETASVVVNYTVTDDAVPAGEASSTLTITVTGTNDGPVADADTAATTENAAVTKDVIANDTDVDATDVLSLKAASAAIATMTGPAGAYAVVTASVTQSGDGITFNPGTDFDFLADGETASVVVNYTVTDDAVPAGEASSTLTITVTGTNDGPVANADTAATTENAAVTKDVIADTDVDATDVLSLKAASAAIATMTGPASAIAVVTASVTQSGNEIPSTRAPGF